MDRSRRTHLHEATTLAAASAVPPMLGISLLASIGVIQGASRCGEPTATNHGPNALIELRIRK